ncbi:MAG: prenyltransferase/squalene oxidase repeat-containing protein [Planctomycetota bacterium]
MLFASLLPLILPLPPGTAPQAPSAKALFDSQLATLRFAQRQDGSYGGRLETAQVVTAMALCPRAYREDDGPFVREAVAWLLQSDPPADAEEAALTALALQSVGAAGYSDRIAEFALQAGIPVATLADLVAGRRPASWPAGVALALPEAQETAAGILSALQPATPFWDRARGCARAALTWRRELAARAAAAPADERARIRAAYEKGADFLLKSRGRSGMWEVFGQPEPGISALAARALLGSPREQDHEAAWPVLDFLKGLQKKDGSIHAGHLPVYVTSVAVMALSAGRRSEDQEAIRNAADYLRAVQTDEGEGYSEADRFYGGIGYGNDLRPDLSNLQYALQALKDSGATAEDPAFQRALVFLQRVQNRSESNTGTYRNGEEARPVKSGNDGGAVYYPGNSPAGYIQLPDGSLVARSYGSMTYALLKAYIFAGLDGKDPRVQAAVEWIEKHWTLEVNPGFDTLRDPRAGFQGLYYYYLSLAEALDAAGIDTLTGAGGTLHPWRRELARKLASLQHEDGSWVNADAPRWWEGNPILCTAYSLDTLQVVNR